ncbi:MAG TPA: HAD-IA family hydrolase [Anaerolineae bacterium]|nr:HAD-IA family hydrolase [Anaerolineae bacterium]
MTLKALLLDFGGVVVMAAYELHHLTEKLLGLPSGFLTWRGPFDPASDPLWQAMQRDEITEREYWDIRAREIGQFVGQEWTVRDYTRLIKCSSPAEAIRPEATETVRLARANGIKVGVLSNELELFYGQECVDRMPIIHELDALIDASHTKILKPEPEAYQMALAALGVVAHETLFVDDQGRNIVGAQQVGLETLHFDVTRPAVCYAQVRLRLGLG